LALHRKYVDLDLGEILILLGVPQASRDNRKRKRALKQFESHIFFSGMVVYCFFSGGGFGSVFSFN
jgi:uncharacterized membrane protein YphA (DoxX/SURF4 family)